MHDRDVHFYALTLIVLHSYADVTLSYLLGRLSYFIVSSAHNMATAARIMFISAMYRMHRMLGLGSLQTYPNSLQTSREIVIAKQSGIYHTTTYYRPALSSNHHRYLSYHHGLDTTEISSNANAILSDHHYHHLVSAH